jgi:ADP-ribose pyrophosphatase
MQVISTDVMYEGKFRVVCDVVKTLDGRICRHETIEHPGAVVVLPILDKDTFLLVEQYRHSIKEVLLEFPAGTLEVGEDPRECAVRELTEEVGMTCDELLSLGELFPAPGFCNEKQYLYCARALRPQRGVPDEDESIVVVQLSKSDVLEAVRTGKLRDAKSIALFMRALVQGYV